MLRDIPQHKLMTFVVSLTILLSSEIALSRDQTRQGVKTMFLDEMQILVVRVHGDGTVLSFPTKPEVHIGKKTEFGITDVKNDLVISARTPNSKTNLFVYLEGRRFTLKLVYGGVSGDQIVSVRDSKDQSFEVNAPW